MRTKADLISKEQLEALDRVPINCPCSYCRELLVTEGDFARHFVLPNERHLNLGECPKRVADRSPDSLGLPSDKIWET